MDSAIFNHVCLSISDEAASEAFYAKLGFRRFAHWEAADKALTITHLTNDSMLLEMICYADRKPAPEWIHDTATDLPVLGTKHFALRVNSIEDAKRDLVERGLIGSDHLIKPGRTVSAYFFVPDPDGILVEIVQDDRPGADFK